MPRHSMRTSQTFRPPHATALSLAMLAASVAAPAGAANVYRSSNTFQDWPCPELKVAANLPAERPLVADRETPCMKETSERSDCDLKTLRSRDGKANLDR